MVNSMVTVSSSYLTHWIQSPSKNELDTDSLIAEAEKKCLDLFHKASTQVPAYKDFLSKRGISAKTVKSLSDFQKLPAISKENYIHEYDLKSRCWDGDLSNLTMISTSSGTTGEPIPWPRSVESEIDGAKLHELFLSDFWNLKQKSTLFINGFALGNWIAGTFTQTSVYLLHLKGYPILMMSPGYDLEAVISTLNEMGSSFDQVIIAGHVPFLKEIVETAVERNIRLDKMSVKLLGSGQAITENWRRYILELIGSHNLYDVINLYGSADAALIGFESPLTINLRLSAEDDIEIREKLFQSNRIPSLYHYDPRINYIEGLNSELHLTKDMGAPLIRYNIHDNGGILTRKIRERSIQTNSLSQRLPVVYLFGREKFMVKVYGANLYTEHVHHALNHPQLQQFISGRFLVETDFDEGNNPKLLCRVELRKGITASGDHISILQSVFVEEVAKLNSEYRYVLEKMGDKVKPRFVLHDHGHPEYFPTDKIKKTA